MHTITIKYKKGTDENELWHKFNSVIGTLRESGQINGREHNPYLKANTITSTLWTFTAEALEQKYWNHYVRTAVAALEILCGSKIKIEHIGHVEDELQSICNCKKYKYFVLYYYGDFSPIRCGTCEKFVPLFKIPKLHDDRIWDINGWVSSYKACVTLDINCGTGEKWAIKQQCEFDSGLSKQGREIAAKITTTSGIKCYYFLSNYTKRSKIKNADRPCPSCGGEWHLKKELFGYFKHKCDKCLLMSAYSNYIK